MTEDLAGVEEQITGWPSDELDALILAGVPGLDVGGAAGDGKHPYPGLAIDVRKALIQRGVRVAYRHDRDQRVIVEHKAADVWVPILAFTADAVASGAVRALIDSLMLILGPRFESSLLHVRICEFRTPNFEFKWFKADGPGKEVADALTRWSETVDEPDD